ncbi:thiamine-phosphate kinase [Biformimicrobium ophioploci]|uniref:Thiamine-monophosphate kinase n=1 Tax=Biformimicrobium ophioploci TaxID=3036711 RepID=A0ABQ6M144_9GAMM|nr:thiamine-phosphate kinase [Microbulbifer sp. NKW57]GMG88041.1 thiamine-phosphate kinase [Microbulbifer sp. NKW57]
MPASKEHTLGEFDLIRRFFASETDADGVVQGIGDDCAILLPPPGQLLATSVDTLVSEVHFPANADPADLANRALRVNLSDLAACAAQPLWFTLALTLPEPDTVWLEGFSRGLREAAQKFGIALVGGDTTRGPLCITIQVTGAAERPLTRAGAQPGDLVYVTGELGAGAAALPLVLSGDAGASHWVQARNAFYYPQPQLEAAALIAPFASAALDVSDGLLADLGHICEQSGVGAEVHAEKVPVAELAAQTLDHDAALAMAVSGGDDYQLCFTVPAQSRSELERLVSAGVLEATEIGRVIEGNAVRMLKSGAEWQPPATGYTHF